jgi:predicted HicB family RNase H-like nuclease
MMSGDTLDNILHKLPDAKNRSKPKQRVMTVRMPEEIYNALQKEAYDRKTSANRIAVAKLALKAELLDHVVETMAAMERAACQNGSSLE